MPTCVRSYSKINLGLAIGPVRMDGFHELATLYQTLAAHDLVTVSAEPGGTEGRPRITLACTDRRVPLDGRNTVWKMLERVLALEPFSGRAWTVHVAIDKRLPMQGGLGAGSANAAAALVGLEQETGLRLAGGDRLRVAAEVGSDVPLFLLGGAVLGLGRGEQVYPMPDLAPEGSPVEVVLAFPGVGVSTPQAFRDWDALVAQRAVAAAGTHSADHAGEAEAARLGCAEAPSTGIALTGLAPSGRLVELSRVLAAALCEPQTSSGVFPTHEREDLAGHTLPALVRTGIRNDFEEVVFRQHPFLGTIKRALLGPSGESATQTMGESAQVPGVLYAALSGSGSALFGLYSNGEAAAEAEGRLRAIGVRTLRTRLLSRAAYWRHVSEPDQA